MILSQRTVHRERAYETDEEDVLQRRILTRDLLRPYKRYVCVEEQQDDGDSEFIARLGRHETVMRQQTEQGLEQSTINSYLT